jgi:hypothetical protein
VIESIMVDVQGTRKALRWTWLLAVAAVLYGGVTIFLRSRENRAMEEEAARKRAESDRQIIERLGSGELKILAFYANPPVIERGGKGLLCYGVANAKAVRIEPGVEPLKPSLSRCVEARTTATTTYTLTATGADGRDATQSVEVTVR